MYCVLSSPPHLAFNLLLNVVMVEAQGAIWKLDRESSVPLVMSVIVDLREIFITCQKYPDQLAHVS
jgi:hypothetical protein